MDRRVTVELAIFGQVTEYTTVPASEAKSILARKMAAGHRWRIVLPDRTGELQNDESRYSADCEACGVPNLLDV